MSEITATYSWYTPRRHKLPRGMKKQWRKQIMERFFQQHPTVTRRDFKLKYSKATGMWTMTDKRWGKLG